MSQVQDTPKEEIVDPGASMKPERIYLGHDIEYEFGLDQVKTQTVNSGAIIRYMKEPDRHHRALFRTTRDLNLERVSDYPGWWTIVESYPEPDLSPEILLEAGPDHCTDQEIRKIVLPHLEAQASHAEAQAQNIDRQMEQILQGNGGTDPRLPGLRQSHQEKVLEVGEWNGKVRTWKAKVPD